MGHCNFKVQGHVIHSYEIKLQNFFFVTVKHCTITNIRRSQWARGLRHQSAAARLLRLCDEKKQNGKCRKKILTLWRRNYFFFLVSAHPVYKM